MATNLVYNDVTLLNVTSDFIQSPVLDESNTDQIYQKFVVTVETICSVDCFLDSHPRLGATTPGLLGGNASLPAIEIAVRRKLMEQRKSFRLTLDGVDILAADATTDVNNGPRPIDLKVHRVSPRTLRITYVIEIATLECGDDNSSVGTGTPPAVLNNRWSCTDEIDDKFRTTRRWKGKLRLSQAATNPHNFRGIVVPVLNRGFKREHLTFIGETNALELSYEIVDKEMLGPAPPDPAVKMAITHVDAMTSGGMKHITDVTVRLEGSPVSNKLWMIQRALQVVQAKILGNAQGTLQGTFLQLILSDYSGDDQNSVEVKAQIERVPDEKDGRPSSMQIGTLIFNTFGQPILLPNYDEEVAPLVGLYGSASTAGLFACYLQSYCNPEHRMPQINEIVPDEEESGRTDKQSSVPVYLDPGLPSEIKSPGYSPEHLEAMYEYTRIESTLIVEENKIHLPIARATGSSGPSSKVLTLAPPIAKRKIKAAFERLGKWPSIWRPQGFTDSQGNVHTLLCFKPMMRAPEQTSEGEKYIFAIDVEYWFALDNAPIAGSVLPVPSLPWDNSTAASQAYPAGSYTDPTGEKGLG